jgi:hypothetical protein
MSVKRRIVESAFWQTPDQRHLSAFESETNAAARARFLTFVAFAARFSVTGTFAATKALDAMARTGTRSQIV